MEKYGTASIDHKTNTNREKRLQKTYYRDLNQKRLRITVLHDVKDKSMRIEEV